MKKPSKVERQKYETYRAMMQSANIGPIRSLEEWIEHYHGQVKPVHDAVVDDKSLHELEDSMDLADNECRGKTVRCADCDRKQPDPGRRGATCPHCGTAPLPSHCYPPGSSFYPKRVTTLGEAVRAIRGN